MRATWEARIWETTWRFPLHHGTITKRMITESIGFPHTTCTTFTTVARTWPMAHRSVMIRSWPSKSYNFSETQIPSNQIAKLVVTANFHQYIPRQKAQMSMTHFTGISRSVQELSCGIGSKVPQLAEELEWIWCLNFAYRRQNAGTCFLTWNTRKGQQNAMGNCKVLPRSNLAKSHVLKTSSLLVVCCVLLRSFAKSSAVSGAFLHVSVTCVSHAIDFRRLVDLVHLCEASKHITNTSPLNTSTKNSVDEFTWSQIVKSTLKSSCIFSCIPFCLFTWYRYRRNASFPQVPVF